jgi:hypothetical protein
MTKRIGRPTAESIAAQCTLAWLENAGLTQAEITGIMWGTYLVDALQHCRTHAELRFLYASGLIHGTLSVPSKVTGTTVIAEHDIADTRLSNSVWGNGKRFYQFSRGKLQTKLHDNRFTIDLEELGYVAFLDSEIPVEVQVQLAARGRVDNTEGWIVDTITKYEEDAMWLNG